MADIQIRSPFRPVDGGEPPLINLRDMGDGTFAPIVSSNVTTGLAAVPDADIGNPALLADALAALDILEAKTNTILARLRSAGIIVS